MTRKNLNDAKIVELFQKFDEEIVDSEEEIISNDDSEPEDGMSIDESDSSLFKSQFKSRISRM